MARAHGKDADFSFDSTILEGEIDSVTLAFDVPAAEITSFTDTYQNVVAGKPSAKIDVSGFWDSGATRGDEIIFGELGAAAKAWDFEPTGSTGYDGFAVVTNYTITANVNDAVKYTAALQHNGGAAAADGAAPTRG